MDQRPAPPTFAEISTAQDFGDILDGDFHIATRSGLHCAPLVHLDLGTSPAGGVRFSLGPFNTAEDVDAALDATHELVIGRMTRS